MINKINNIIINITKLSVFRFCLYKSLNFNESANSKANNGEIYQKIENYEYVVEGGFQTLFGESE
jgi:hypothetical protein